MDHILGHAHVFFPLLPLALQQQEFKAQPQLLGRFTEGCNLVAAARFSSEMK